MISEDDAVIGPALLAFAGAFLCLPGAMFVLTLRLAGVIGQKWSCVLLFWLFVTTAIFAAIFFLTF